MSRVCAVCNKGIRLVDETIKCKCDGFFCRVHRFPAHHNCTFDTKEENRKQLEAKLGKGYSEKLYSI